MPPIIRDQGNRNMVWPKVVCQSGTASADPVLVTSPPTKMSSMVAPAVTTANRCGHGRVGRPAAELGALSAQLHRSPFILAQCAGRQDHGHVSPAITSMSSTGRYTIDAVRSR